MARLKGDGAPNSHPDADTSSEDASSGREDEEDDDEEEQRGELSAFGDSKEELKLVLVVRSDLGMGKGKIAAQVAHAAVACYSTLLAASTSTSPASQGVKGLLRRWERGGGAKVCVQTNTHKGGGGGGGGGGGSKEEQADGEEELLLLQAQAISLGLCARIIRDAGRTQIAAGSATVLGVGPGPKGVVDRVTGGLKLL